MINVFLLGGVNEFGYFGVMLLMKLIFFKLVNIGFNSLVKIWIVCFMKFY